MEVDYYSKYMKYKSKYLELKKQIGGVQKCYFKNDDNKECICTQFIIRPDESRACYRRGCYFICNTCSHEDKYHKDISNKE